MTARGRLTTSACTLVFAASAVSGADLDFGTRDSATTKLGCCAPEAPSLETTSNTAIDAAARGPILHPRLSERVTRTLEEAIPVAQEHLRDHPSCQALFAHFGANGVAKLNATSYFPAGPGQEKKYCRGDSLAVTTVGGSAVVLCRSFARLSPEEAAVILIHEALHFAGQTEYPSDPDAPKGSRISQTVMKSCGLSTRRAGRRGLRGIRGG